MTHFRKYLNLLPLSLFTFIIFSPFFSLVAYMDAPHPWQVGFQDPATPIMEGIVFFNGLLMAFMLLIAFFVGWLLYKSLVMFNESINKEPGSFSHSTLLEVVWTIVPAAILMVISVPSYNLLYALEEVIDPSLTIKVIGHQWYWSYECSDFEVAPETSSSNISDESVETIGEVSLNRAESSFGDISSREAAAKIISRLQKAPIDLNYVDKKFKFDVEVVDGKLDETDDLDIRHKGLSRTQREAFLAEAELDRSEEKLELAKEKFYVAEKELATAKSTFEWAALVQSALELNKASADDIETSTRSEVDSPSFNRSMTIRKGGFESWTDYLRSNARRIAEGHKRSLIVSEEEYLHAQEVLKTISGSLNVEEAKLIFGIGEISEASYKAIADKILPVQDELDEVVGIPERAIKHLEAANSFAEQCKQRLDRAELLCDSAKMDLEVTRKEFEGATNFSNKVLDCNDNSESGVFPGLNLPSINSDVLKEKFASSKNLLIAAEARLAEASARAEVTAENVFKAASILEKTSVLKQDINSSEKYDNFVWEINARDLLQIETQSKNAAVELQVAEKARDKAKCEFAEVLEACVDKSLRSFLDNGKVSYDVLGVLEAISEKAKSSLEEGPTENNAVLKIIFNKVNEMLKKADCADAIPYSGSNLFFEHRDEYASLFLENVKSEFEKSEEDYVMSLKILAYCDIMLRNHKVNLEEVSLRMEQSLWEKHGKSLEAAEESLSRIIKNFDTGLNASLVEIKLTPGYLGSKAYFGLLEAKAELDNIKWISERLAEDVKKLTIKSEKSPLCLGYSAVEEEFYEEDYEDGDSEKQRINFDSYLIADDDLVIPEVSGTAKAGKVFRLLEVDNRLLVPTNTHIRVLVTSADVLHSWAVPSLGVKVDACPGRLNQVFLFVKREGVFYGQCSELCGVNHGFMPIVVQAVNHDDYLTWVGKRLCS